MCSLSSYKPVSILMFPSMPYPCDHAFLEEVYTKVLKKKGYKIVWVMRSKDPIKKKQIRDWHGTKVYLFRGPSVMYFFIERLWQKILYISEIPRYIRILKKEQIDVVQVRNSAFNALLALCFKKVFKTKFVFQRSIPMEDMILFAIEKGIIDKRISRLLKLHMQKRIVYFSMKKADLVLPISDAMKDEFVKIEIPRDKMLSMPLGFNLDMIPLTNEIRKTRKKLKLNGFHSVIYQGSMGENRNLEFLIRAFKIVISKVENARLIMLGGNVTEAENKEALKKYARKIRVNSKIIWIGKVPRADVPKYIAAADIAVSPIVPLRFFLYASPTKLIETMGVGKAVVCNDLPEQEKLIKASKAGICVEYDETRFANAIIKLLEDPEMAVVMGKRGARWVSEHRSYDILARQLEKRYCRILGKQIK